MKTAYVFRSEARNYSYDIHEISGMYFYEAILDVRAIDGLILENKARVRIQQNGSEVDGKFIPDRPTFWFLILSNLPIANESLEREFAKLRRLTSSLFPYTKMRLAFSYEGIWCFPHLPSHYELNSTFIELNEKGGLKGIAYIDPVTLSSVNEQTHKLLAKLHTVNADLLTCLGSPTQQTQVIHSHMTLPTDMVLDVSKTYQTTASISQILTNGIVTLSDERALFVDFYNKAITTKDIFVAYLLLYQMVELCINIGSQHKAASPGKDNTKVSEEARTRLRSFLENDQELKPLTDRIGKWVASLEKLNSRDLMLIGLHFVLGHSSELSISAAHFRLWRKQRGWITHAPKKDEELPSQLNPRFASAYRTLRNCMDECVNSLLCMENGTTPQPIDLLHREQKEETSIYNSRG